MSEALWPGLVQGIVMETTVESLTGDALYSDFAIGKGEKNTTLNTLVKIPLLGIGAGFARVVLGIIHTLGHLLRGLFTGKKGHLFHAAKGACEVLRGMIETLPIIGRIFAHLYDGSFITPPTYANDRCWWMIKIYNPEKPDGLDTWMDNWEHYPACYYIKE